jgi:hypothetical protein
MLGQKANGHRAPRLHPCAAPPSWSPEGRSGAVSPR